MTPARRARAVALMAVQVGTTALGLAKLARRPAERIPGRKWVWAGVIIANLAATLAVRVGRLAADPGPPDQPLPARAPRAELDPSVAGA